MNNKPTVHYDKPSLVFNNVGKNKRVAIMRVWDNPSPLVTNGEMMRTSLVESYDEDTGRIETLNTIYIPG